MTVLGLGLAIVISMCWQVTSQLVDIPTRRLD